MPKNVKLTFFPLKALGAPSLSLKKVQKKLICLVRISAFRIFGCETPRSCINIINHLWSLSQNLSSLPGCCNDMIPSPTVICYSYLCWLCITGFLVRVLEEITARQRMPLGWVASAMKQIGLSTALLLNVYDRLFKAKVGSDCTRRSTS